MTALEPSFCTFSIIFFRQFVKRLSFIHRAFCLFSFNICFKPFKHGIIKKSTDISRSGNSQQNKEREDPVV